jgi:hypothetical protein
MGILFAFIVVVGGVGYGLVLLICTAYSKFQDKMNELGDKFKKH